jgi:hypothetical protein
MAVLSSEEVEKLTGATYPQLYRWARKGWLPAMETPRGGAALGPWTPSALKKAQFLALASKHFCPDGKIRLEALADFVRRAAEAGVKP